MRATTLHEQPSGAEKTALRMARVRAEPPARGALFSQRSPTNVQWRWEVPDHSLSCS